MIGQEKSGKLRKALLFFNVGLFSAVLTLFAWILELDLLLAQPHMLWILAVTSLVFLWLFIAAVPLCSNCKRSIWTVFKRSPICCFTEKVSLRKTFGPTLTWVAVFYLASGVCAIYFPQISKGYQRFTTQMKKKMRRPNREFFDAAVRVQRARLAKEPNDAAARKELGYVLYRAFQFEDAAKQYKAVLAKDESDLEARLFLGITYGAQGLFRLEEEEYKKILKNNPHDVETRVNLGINYLRQKVYKKAFEEFDKTVRATDKQIRHLTRLAQSDGVADEEIPKRLASERYRMGVSCYNLAIASALLNDFAARNRWINAAQRAGVDIRSFSAHVERYRK